MKLIKQLITAFILAFSVLLPTAAEPDMPTIPITWFGHDISFLLPSNFIATEESDSEISYSDNQSGFAFTLCEIDHNQYGSSSAAQIENLLRAKLNSLGAIAENSYAQTRQTNAFRIRSIIAPQSSNSSAVFCCACLIGNKRTFLVIIRTSQPQFGLASIILDSFEER